MGIDIYLRGILQHFHAVEGLQQVGSDRQHAMVFHDDAGGISGQAPGHGIGEFLCSGQCIGRDGGFADDGIRLGNQPDVERLVGNGEDTGHRRMGMDDGLYIGPALVDFQMHRCFAAGLEVRCMVGAVHADFGNLVGPHTAFIGGGWGEQDDPVRNTQGNIAAGSGGQSLLVETVHAVGHGLLLIDHFALSFVRALRNGIA